MNSFHCALFILLITHPAFAVADADWPVETTLPKALGAGAGGGVQNNLVVTSSGRIICTYSEFTGTGGNELYQTSSNDGGSTWSSPVLLNPLGTAPLGQGHPSTALGSDNDLHLVWSGIDTSSGSPVRQLYYARQDTGSGAWLDSAVVASNPLTGGYGYYHVTVDRQDRTHVIWHEGTPVDPHWSLTTSTRPVSVSEVFYRRRAASSGSFETAWQFTTTDTLSAAFANADLSAVSGDTIAFTWREEVTTDDWDVRMIVSHDGGASWGAVFSAAGGMGQQWDPYLLVDDQGVFHLGWHTNKKDAFGKPDYRMNIGHSRDDGLTWQNQAGASGFLEIASSTMNFEFAKMAYDVSRKVVWLMWKAAYSPGLNDVAVTWISHCGHRIQSSYEIVSDIGGTHGMAFPDIAVGPDGRPCVTFQHDHDTTPADGDTSLYFRKRSSFPSLSSFSGAWIYGGNVGWLNANWGSGAECAAPQVTDYFASGYVYAGNLGWLHLGDGSPTDGTQYSQTGGDYGVNLDPATGALSGHAYGANFGWVKFDWASATAMGSHAPRLDLTTGKFSGYAYGGNIGWIRLDAVSTAYLAVNAISPGDDSDSDGIPDAHERRALWLAGLPISLDTLGGASDLDGDGVSDLDEYLAGTRADAAGDAFRTTHTEHTPLGIVLDWKVAPGRVYDVQGSPTMAPNSWVNLATGLKPPTGADEHGVVIELPENTARQFYRVVVRQPLHP
jgi:hypothetical protein